MPTLKHRMLNSALLGVSAALTVVAITGCGGSGSASSAMGSQRVARASSGSGRPDLVTSGATTDHAAKTPVHSNPDTGAATAPPAPKHGSHTDAAAGAGTGTGTGTGTGHVSDQVVKGGGSQKARHVALVNDETSGTATQHNPCSLVTLAQAQAIAGGAISTRFEAPQGPTCIYRPADAKTEITLALEAMAASQVTNHLGQRQKLMVAGRTAYCGKLGHQLLIVPLAGGQLLSVTAPCGVARQFAAAALGRLGA
ncbi:MAG: hypothetical protein WBQ18_21350 [Solirubrobacteraceae bacterium]